VIFRPRELPFHVRNDGGQQQLLFCALNDSQFPDEFRELGRDPDLVAQLGFNIKDAHVQRALIRLFHEAINPGFGATTLSEALLLMGLVDLSRYFEQQRRSIETSRTSSLAPWQLRRVFERLADDSMLPPAVTELATLIGVSRRHLARAFKASTGRTVAATVAETQLTRARRYLAGDAPLKEIAHRLGFGDHSSFSAAFRRATGRSPSDYRREVQATVVQMPVHMNSGRNPNFS
jgi:AraC family transcriptional regulator